MVPSFGDDFAIDSNEDVHIATIHGCFEKGKKITLLNNTSDVYFEKGGNVVTKETVRYPKGNAIELEYNGKKWSLKNTPVEVPVTIVGSGDVTVASGDTAEFSVTVTGGSGNFEYRWFRSADSGNTWVKSSYTGASTEKLSCTVKESMYNYMFRCRVRDKETQKEFYSDAMLLKGPSVTIKINPKDRKVKAGADAIFTVTATGDIKSYQWYRSKDGGKNFSKVFHPGYKTTSMTVPTKSNMNGYQFYCEITDSNGNKYNSRVAKLTVTK